MRSRRRLSDFPKSLIALAAASLLVPESHAGIVSWGSGGDGFWDVGSNWNGSVVPANGSDVQLTTAGTRVVTYRQDTTTLNSLTVGTGNTLSVTSGTLNAGTLANTGVVNVGSGAFNVSGGSSGTMSLVGGVMNLSGTLNASGAITLQGGTLTGGTVQESGGNGLVITSSSGTLDGVTVRGVLNVGDAVNTYAAVRISNGLSVKTESGGAPGVINVGTVGAANTNGSYGRIGFTGTQTLDNATLNLGNASTYYGSSSNVSLDAGGTFTLGAGGTIQGAGSVGSATFQGGTNNLVNNGTIGATFNGLTLTINNSGTLTNNGVLRAAGGGVLNISPSGNWSNAGVIRVADASSTINLGGTLTVASLGTFDNVAGGNLNLTGTLTNTGTTLTFSPATGSIRLAGGTLTGGTVQESGGNGLVITSSSGTLDGVTVRGVLNVGDAVNTYAAVRISNGLSVKTESGGAPGVINVGTVGAANTNGSYGRIGFTGTQTLDNATLNLGNASTYYGSSSNVSLDAGGTFTLGAGGTIQGAGSVGSATFQGGTNNLVNNGTIGATFNGLTLTINNSGTLTNNGVLRAAGGGVLNISPSGNWSNAGVIRVADASSTINLGGTLTVASLGTFDNVAGGNLNLTGTLTNTGTTLTFSPATGSIRLAGGTLTGGTVQESGGNGLVITSSSGTLDGVTVRGVLNVGDAVNTYAAVRISNGLSVKTESGGAPGVINVGTVGAANTNGSYGRIGFTGTQTLDNATLNLGNASTYYGSSSNVSLDAGGTFTLGAGGTIQGAGSVGSATFQGGTNNLVNNGTIGATFNGLTLTINNSGTLTNNGVLRAAGGGVLNISPSGNWSNAGVIRVADASSTINLGGTLTVASLGTFDNVAGGNLNLTGTLTNTGTTLTFSPATGSIRLAGGTLTGGTVQESGGNGLVITSSSGTLDGVTVRGVLNVGDAVNTYAAVRISNGLSVKTESGGAPGVINVGTVGAANTNGSYGRIGFTGTQTLDNATLNLGNASTYYGSSSNVSLDAGGTFTLGAGGTIQGAGSVGSATFQGGTNNLVNNGTIGATFNGLTLTINNSGTLTNNGVLRAAGGGMLNISPSAGLTNFSGTTLTGGTYSVIGSSTLQFAGANVVTNAATILLDGGGSVFRNSTNNTDGLANLAANTSAGSFTIQNGRNFTTVGAFGNGGAVGIGAASTYTTTGAYSNLASAQTQLAGGTLDATSLTNSGTIVGFGTVSPAVANTGSVLASGGALTLSAGVQGASGAVGVAAGATLNLGANSSAATLAQNGALALGTHNITVSSDYTNANFGAGNSFDRRAGVTGAGQILAAGTTQQTLSGSAVQNGTASVATLALSNMRVGQGAATASYTINNTGSGGPNLRGAIQTSGITNAGLSGSGVTAQNWGALSQGGSGQTYTVSFNPTTGQALSGQSVQLVNNFDNVAGQTLQITGKAYNVASATTLAPNPVTFANRHVGDVATQTLTLANAAPTGSFSEGLTAGFSGTSGAATATGSIALLAAGASNASSLVVGLNTGAAGAKSGTATVALTSNGTGTSGLANLSIGAQTVAISGNVYRLAEAATIAPVSFGNLHIGDTASRSLTIGNVASTDGYSERLTASFGTASDTRITTSGSVSQLSAGQADASSMKVGLNTSAAGTVNGSVAVNFASDGAGTSGLGITALPSQSVGVSGVIQTQANVYNYASASPASPNPVNFGNVHVGSIATQALTITNTAPAGGFSESLNASIGGATAGVTAGGSFNLLAAQATNSTALTVGLATSTAGARSGTATITLASDGTGTSGLGTTALPSQTVAISGNVYRLAEAATIAPVSFGNLHIGDTASRSLTIGNVASTDGYSERLTASFGTASDTRITTSGSVSQLSAGQADASSMKVGLNTSAAGTVNGSVAVNFASDGAGTSGLGITALPSQSVGVSGVIQTQANVYNYASASNASPNPVNFGNVRIGSTATQALTITNTAPAGGFSESLNASIGGATAGVTAGGSFNLLAAQATNSTALTVGLATSTAGARSGTATITLASDGTGTSGLGTTALPSQTVAISGNVYRLASPVLATPSVTLAARVSDTAPVAAISIGNASPDSYTERLKASFGTVSTGFTGSGAISGLAAGASSSAMTVGLNTAAAGSFTGSAALDFVSSGAGTTGAADLALAGKSVGLTGHVYTPAVATLGTTSVDFGIVHRGDTVSARNVSVTNSAPSTAANDTLSGSLQTGSTTFTASGSVSGLAAQSTVANAFAVGLNTSAAGSFSGIATGTFASHNADMTDLGLGAQTLAVSAQVNNYADVAIASAGTGALTHTGHTYLLDFGNVMIGSTNLGASLSVLNSATGFADLLSGNFQLSAIGSEFALSGFGSFAGLVAGSSIDGLTIAFDDSTAGFYESSLVLHASGSNASGYIGALADTTLVLRGNVIPTVAAVPEPGTYVLMFAGLLVVVGAGRLRRADGQHRAQPL